MDKPRGFCRVAVDGYYPLMVLARAMSQRAAEIASNTHQPPYKSRNVRESFS
jgi:hypothetical protein